MNDKARLANAAVARVNDGAVVGLGTGSTANAFVDALAERVRGGLRVTTVASSTTTAERARLAGLPLLGFEHVDRVDLYVDGCDAIDAALDVVKGRGADLVREKLLAKGAGEFVVLADASKVVARVGAGASVPVEVLPFAWRLAQAALSRAGATSALRQNPSKDGHFVTSAGNLVLEAVFVEEDAAAIDACLNGVCGVVEHGVFAGLVARAFVIEDGAIVEKTKKR